MSKNLILTVLFAISAFAFTHDRACADSIPWGYSAANTEIFNNNSPAMSSSVKFNGASGVATGSSGIIIYNMAATSGVSESSPDSFSNVPFDLAFTLVDIKATSSVSGSAKSSDVVHFGGLFSASNVTKTSLMPGANPWSSPVVAEVTLGADDVGWRTYSVTLSSFTSPGQPGGSPGSIQAIVRVSAAGAPVELPEPPDGQEETPAPNAAPEPASLVLAGLSLPLFVLIRRRRNQTHADDASAA
jgi:hypothetical protein